MEGWDLFSGVVDCLFCLASRLPGTSGASDLWRVALDWIDGVAPVRRIWLVWIVGTRALGLVKGGS